MGIIELTGILTAGFYLYRISLKNSHLGVCRKRILMILIASWIMEESAIRIYGFYHYHEIWTLKLGHVPLLVVMTWPILIYMAFEMASRVSSAGARFIPLLGALVVLSDALFIEPIAVQTGLWSWRQPGIFGVPPIGFAGWFLFASACLYFIHRHREHTFCAAQLLDVIYIIAGTHGLLILSWWGAFKWFHVQLNGFVTVSIAWGLSLLLSWVFLKKKTGLPIQRTTLLLRLPAVAFFWVLLLTDRNDWLLLVCYACAFIPPYLVLVLQSQTNRLQPGSKSTRLPKVFGWKN